MSQNFTPTLKRLEANFSEMERRRTEVRVAGKSPMEFKAETLAIAFSALESRKPGFATELAEAAVSAEEDEIPADESTDNILLMLAKMIRSTEERHLGMVHRVLDAVVNGAEAITEETLFPDGRPITEQTWGSRHGKLFHYRLDSTG